MQTVEAWQTRFGIVAFDLNAPVPDKLSALGVGLVRGSCDWPSLEPARGVYQWDCADNVIVGARKAGFKSYMTVGCTPGWANGGAGCGKMPADITDWYWFVANFVSRYSSFDTILGVWNEPNLTLPDAPGAAGANYALLFINASNARNTVNPRFVLAGPETSDDALASGYFERTVDAIQGLHGFDPQDVFAVHWYNGGTALHPYLDTVHHIIGDAPVWLTETGIAADDATQTAFFGTMLDEFTNGQRPWWTHLVFYRLWDGLDCCTEAILRRDFTSRPAFDALRALIASRPFEPNPAGPRPPHKG